MEAKIPVQPNEQLSSDGMKHAVDTSPTKINPRVSKAENSIGKAGVKTPWEGSHQITQPGGPHWQAHHQNSQGLNGQTTWEHKGAKRGNKVGPDQRTDPYQTTNTKDGTDQSQGYL